MMEPQVAQEGASPMSYMDFMASAAWKMPRSSMEEVAGCGCGVSRSALALDRGRCPAGVGWWCMDVWWRFRGWREGAPTSSQVHSTWATLRSGGTTRRRGR